MINSGVDEVRRLHVFIESWMSSAADDPARWQGFCDSLAVGFEMVVPDGVLVSRAELLEGFVGARGARPGVRIEIRNATVLVESGDTTTVRYEEWQLHADDEFTNQRVSTAVLRRADEAPGGWLWLALHETWLNSR